MVGSEVQYAAVSAGDSGDNELVEEVSGSKIRVLSAYLVAAGAVGAVFESGTDDGDLSGAVEFAAAMLALVLPFNGEGWFETVAGEALNLRLDDAVVVGGGITYVLVDD